MQVKVRRFEDRDFSDYVKVLEKTWPLPYEDAEETIRKRLKTLSKKGERILTTEVDGRAVGFMLIYFENPPSPPELSLRVNGW